MKRKAYRGRECEGVDERGEGDEESAVVKSEVAATGNVTAF
jgi:hypothetical protein